jgi:hypothetical protein
MSVEEPEFVEEPELVEFWCNVDDLARADGERREMLSEWVARCVSDEPCLSGIGITLSRTV